MRSINELEAVHGPLADVLPLSPLQEGLLFHAVRDGEADVYTLTARFDLSGPLDEVKLADAFETVIDRHPNLRAAFHYEQFERPVQIDPLLQLRPFLLGNVGADVERNPPVSTETVAGSACTWFGGHHRFGFLLAQLDGQGGGFDVAEHEVLAADPEGRVTVPRFDVDALRLRQGQRDRSTDE